MAVTSTFEVMFGFRGFRFDGVDYFSCSIAVLWLMFLSLVFYLGWWLVGWSFATGVVVHVLLSRLVGWLFLFEQCWFFARDVVWFCSGGVGGLDDGVLEFSSLVVALAVSEEIVRAKLGDDSDGGSGCFWCCHDVCGILGWRRVFRC